jgi:hypothetical protein
MYKANNPKQLLLKHYLPALFLEAAWAKRETFILATLECLWLHVFYAAMPAISKRQLIEKIKKGSKFLTETYIGTVI